jgi:dihydroorotate dehydrogenase
MTPGLASALLPLLRRMDAERAHELALRALRMGLAGSASGGDDPALATQAFGLRFANPIGLAAGFDKNAVAVRGLMRLGFGFVETGTATPRPQAGNPKPRLFRMDADRAVVNRMGFNNAGLDAYVRGLAENADRAAPLGANVGINKEGADPIRDYPAAIAAVARHVDYVTINVSSPNTPGLRDLQSEEKLREILEAVAKVPERPPILLKVAPDLSDDGLEAAVETCVAFGVAGMIVGNTTISRPSGWASTESGGLSGRPLFSLSTKMLAKAYVLARGRLTLVGTGGVFNAQDALMKIRAGASLVQFYTGFAFQGPAMVPRLKRELAGALREAGFANVQQAVGTAADSLSGYG